jgi:hypothetical protein
VLLLNAARWKQLTLPQRELMWELADRARYVASYYKPRPRLEQLELIQLERGVTSLTPLGWVTLQPSWPMPKGWEFRASKEYGLCCVTATHEDGRILENKSENFRLALQVLKHALETQ